MTYKNFLKELGKAGLTVREFADLLQMNRNSISNYARKGEVPCHLAVIAALIGEMNIQGIDFHAIFSRIKVAPKMPRGNAKRGRFGGSPQKELGLEP